MKWDPLRPMNHQLHVWNGLLVLTEGGRKEDHSDRNELAKQNGGLDQSRHDS